tara:strand:- start:365 stop:592 length:228 start_codon:yes stop_codon:yes gene_type:complete
MDYIDREMTKTSRLVRRVRANEVPEDVVEPVDWGRELDDDFAWVWQELLIKLYLVLAVMALAMLAAGFIWGLINA